MLDSRVSAGLTNFSSPAPWTWEWLARICSIKVVPDRGSPKTNTGSFGVVNRSESPFDCIQHLDAAALHRLAQQHEEELRLLAGAQPARIVDKMPDNYMYLGLLARLLWTSLKAAAGMAHRTKEPKAKKPATSAQSAKTKKHADQSGKLSALDAAAKVLQEAGHAMNCQELIQAMAAKGYWTSPAGKTPSATLYSGIMRETKTKGSQARFQKTSRGHFRLTRATQAS